MHSVREDLTLQIPVCNYRCFSSQKPGTSQVCTGCFCLIAIFLVSLLVKVNFRRGEPVPCITLQCVHSHAQIKVKILPQNGGGFLQFSFWSVFNFVINVLGAVIDFRDKLKPRVHASSPTPKQLLGSRFKIVQNQNKRIAIS